MKILCVSCERLAELQSYRVDAGVLMVTCARCGMEMIGVDAPKPAVTPATESSAAAPPPPATPRVVPLRAVGADPAVIAAKAAASSSDPFSAPEGRCPKCIAKRRGGELSCTQCGLTFVNFIPREVIPPSPLDKMWKELLSKWDDQLEHDRLLAAAVTQSALPSIARLYQIRLAVSPDDPLARRGRDEVLRLATASATAFVPGTTGGDRTKTIKFATFALGIVMVLVLSLILIRQIGSSSAP